MKCRVESDILLSSCSPADGVLGNFSHKCCQSCHRKENSRMSTNHKFTCALCHGPFHDNILSIDEAILFGEALNIRAHIIPQLSLPAEVVVPIENINLINEMSKVVVEKLESALRLNPSSFNNLYILFVSCGAGYRFLMEHKLRDSCLEYYTLKLFDYSYKLLNYPVIPDGHGPVKRVCCYELARIFHVYRNWAPALEYAKQAYEHCLRSPNHANLDTYKALYLEYRAVLAKQPPLRFAVGDEVEFLHELETGSEWKLGRIVVLYYREQNFAINFSAPYRLEILDDSDQPTTYAWVKADLDRYIRKEGVRSIEDTRYQARLDAKVAELAHVYCSKEFNQEVYRILAQDRVFVVTLLTVWQIVLSEFTIQLYRMLVLYRQPFVRTDTGYHIPTTDEVIAGIKAFFDPVHMRRDGREGSESTPLDEEVEDIYAKGTRAYIMGLFRGTLHDPPDVMDNNDIQGLLLRGTRNYLTVSIHLDPSRPTADLLDQGSDFTVPTPMAEALAKVATVHDLKLIQLAAKRQDDDFYTTKLGHYVSAWVRVHICLENPDAGPACECPFVYFFIKYCLDNGFGVPKLALIQYDRMNMQLSREFIRCAYPTCELNKLDQSTGQVKFKKCSRCHAVIYCSRECQVAHYPVHKRLCRDHHATSQEGS